MEFLFTILFAFGLILIMSLAAAACAPKLILDAKTRPLLPILGILILAVATSLWHATDFSARYLQVFFVLVSLLGAWRLFALRAQISFKFDPHYVLLGLFILPTAVKLGMSAFDVNDEIYSWNLWANQIFYKQAIDYYFTQAPYPTLFSSLVAGCYLLLGSTDHQSVTKLVLWLLPYCCLALLLASTTVGKRGLFWLVAIVLMYGAGLEKVFSFGLADPLMAIWLFAGLSCLCSANNSKHVGSNTLLTLSAIFIAASALTKQAALVWSLVFYPIALTLYIRRHELSVAYSVLSLVPILTSLIWLATIGSGFHNNEGVVQASMGSRGFVEQFFFAAKQLFVELPAGALLLLVLTWVSLKNREIWLRLILAGSLVSAFLWLMFGSYDLRLGMHVFLVLWLLSTISFFGHDGYAIVPSKTKIIALLLFCGLMPSAYAVSKYLELSGEYSLNGTVVGFDHGRDRQALKLFGADGPNLVQRLESEGGKVWVGSNYIYGVMYGVLPVAKPELDQQKPIAGLINAGVDYVLISKDAYGFGSANAIMRTLIERHPVCFERQPMSANYLNVEAYKAAANMQCRAF